MEEKRLVRRLSSFDYLTGIDGFSRMGAFRFKEKDGGFINVSESLKIPPLTIVKLYMDILRSMPSWLWDDYVARVRTKDYTLEERRDKKDVLRGYTVGIGDVIYKASELGKGRNLMASKIEATWNRLHNQSVTELNQNGNQVKTLAATSPEAKPETTFDKPAATYSSWCKGTSRYELTHKDKDYCFYIPDDVLKLFDDEFDYRETANNKELTDYAVALFVGMMSASGGGGGTSNDFPWGQKED